MAPMLLICQPPTICRLSDLGPEPSQYGLAAGGADPAEPAQNNTLETKTVVAEQKIYHSTEYPSHVELPLIPLW